MSRNKGGTETLEAVRLRTLRSPTTVGRTWSRQPRRLDSRAACPTTSSPWTRSWRCASAAASSSPPPTSTAGIANTYDYGHYGVLLKNNVVAAWWKAMIQERDDIVALDSAIIQHPRTWEASGHLAGFTDPLIDCKTCKQRFRADHLAESPCGRKPSKHAGRDAGVRPHRGARVQPHVRDLDRPGEGRGLDRLPAPRDRPGHLPQLQERAPVRAPQAAVRDRAGRQVVPQRDHPRQLHLPHARVRADGDGVLRPARRGPAVARALAAGAHGLVHRPRHPPRPPDAAPARRRRALPLLLGHERRRVPVSDRLVRARGDRQPRRLRPHPARAHVGREARVLRPADRASATSRT